MRKKKTPPLRNAKKGWGQSEENPIRYLTLHMGQSHTSLSQAWYSNSNTGISSPQSPFCILVYSLSDILRSIVFSWLNLLCRLLEGSSQLSCTMEYNPDFFINKEKVRRAKWKGGSELWMSSETVEKPKNLSYCSMSCSVTS